MTPRITAPNLAALYRQSAERYETLPAFATRKKSLSWEPISFRDLYEQGRQLATGLIELGVEAQEPVGVFSDNRVEWALADYGIQLCAAVNTPRGTDVTDDDLTHIINHAGIRVAFVENSKVLDKLNHLRPVLPHLREVILMAPTDSPPDGARTLRDLITAGAEKLDQGDSRAEKRVAAIRPGDLFTLIYTSGTTGEPKGVMLTHANLMSQIEHVPLELSCTDRVLSILPIWHIFERMFEVYAIYWGACNYYTSTRTLGDDLKNVEPTFMGSAPRLWESLHHRILQGIRNAHPVRRALFHIAYFLASRHRESMFLLKNQHLQLSPPSPVKHSLLKVAHLLRVGLLLPWYGFFNAAVLEAIRQRAGGSLKATISGGGALPLDIDKFFNYIGIPVLEGYGLTETSPVLAVRTPDKMVCGTVGPLIPHTHLRIVDLDSETILFPDPDDPRNGRTKRGEIRVRGPQIMKGYYREPDLTREVLSSNGWFRTGDIGMVTFNDTLKILGRRKATIVLSNGENVEPGPIEVSLQQCEFIDQCMVVGQDRKFIAALIVPDQDALARHGIQADSLAQLAEDPKALELIRREIQQAVARPGEFGRFEKLRDFRLLPEPFTVGDELTNLFKLKRHVVETKYRALIGEIYTGKTNPPTEALQ